MYYLITRKLSLSLLIEMSLIEITECRNTTSKIKYAEFYCTQCGFRSNLRHELRISHDDILSV